MVAPDNHLWNRTQTIGFIIKARKVLRNESLKSLYYSFIYPYLIYCNQVWVSACKIKHRIPIYFTKEGLKNYQRCSSQVAFRAIVLSTEVLELWKHFKYLVGRHMYRVYHEELTTPQFLFIKHCDIHMHDTHQRGHYHIPLCRTNLGKSSLRYFGALLWNKVLNADINPIVSDFIFSRNLQTTIYNDLL